MNIISIVRLLTELELKIDRLKNKEDKEFIKQLANKLDGINTIMISVEDQERLYRIHTEIT